MSHNMGGMAPYVSMARGRNQMYYTQCSGPDLGPPPQHMQRPCFPDEKMNCTGMGMGEPFKPPMMSAIDPPPPKKKRRSSSNTANAANNQPPPPPVMQDLLPPPLSGYGDTIVASNPFDDTPPQMAPSHVNMNNMNHMQPPPHMRHMPCSPQHPMMHMGGPSPCQMGGSPLNCGPPMGSPMGPMSCVGGMNCGPGMGSPIGPNRSPLMCPPGGMMSCGPPASSPMNPSVGSPLMNAMSGPPTGGSMCCGPPASSPMGHSIGSPHMYAVTGPSSGGPMCCGPPPPSSPMGHSIGSPHMYAVSGHPSGSPMECGAVVGPSKGSPMTNQGMGPQPQQQVGPVPGGGMNCSSPMGSPMAGCPGMTDMGGGVLNRSPASVGGNMNSMGGSPLCAGAIGTAVSGPVNSAVQVNSAGGENKCVGTGVQGPGVPSSGGGGCQPPVSAATVGVGCSMGINNMSGGGMSGPGGVNVNLNINGPLRGGPCSQGPQSQPQNPNHNQPPQGSQQTPQNQPPQQQAQSQTPQQQNPNHQQQQQQHPPAQQTPHPSSQVNQNHSQHQSPMAPQHQSPQHPHPSPQNVQQQMPPHQQQQHPHGPVVGHPAHPHPHPHPPQQQHPGQQGPPPHPQHQQQMMNHHPPPPSGMMGPGGMGPAGMHPGMGMHNYPGPKPMPVSAGKIYPADQSMVFNPQNPNAPPIYPCGICHKEVHDNDQAILCESGCNFWFHRVCTGLIEAAYQLLTAEVYAEWVCDKCLSSKNIPLVKFKP